ncbi:hypothetical protein BGZ51_005097 [Haplosporangium sp. Z 767]|nr:hypothetical protein BGZ51_005097 [Haplosporangium sp. Z 767]
MDDGKSTHEPSNQIQEQDSIQMLDQQQLQPDSNQQQQPNSAAQDEVSTTAPSIMLYSEMGSSQDNQVDNQVETSSSKRAASEEPSTQTELSAEISTQSQQSQENMIGSDSSSSSSKRRRISRVSTLQLPGRSILKSASQDGDNDLEGSQDALSGNTIGNGSLFAIDVTESFNSTTEFRRRSRKSIGRRVSFATTARIRMFDRDDKDEDNPKTTSYIEGRNPKVVINTPFIFERLSQDNAENTVDSVTSTNDEQSSHARREQSVISTESSDSEKERSFEIDLNAGVSDSTGSSGANTGLYLGSSETSSSGTPFDIGDLEHGSCSEDDDSSFFPEMKNGNLLLEARTYQDEKDDVLGPQINMGLQDPQVDMELQGSDQFSLQGDDTDDGTQDMSMASQDYSVIFSLQKQSSAIPDSQPPVTDHDGVDQHLLSEFTNFDASQTSSQAPSTGDIPSTESNHGSNFLDQAIPDNFSAGDKSAGDGDTDMDITAPIGVGIHELLRENPPTAFHNADENTLVFSDTDTPMDMTQPIGVGIRELIQEQPPTAFQTADGDTAMFSDTDAPMDMTQTIGVGIRDVDQDYSRRSFVHSEDDNDTAKFSDLGTPMDMTQTIGAGILESHDSSVVPKDTALVTNNSTRDSLGMHSTLNRAAPPSQIRDTNNNTDDTRESYRYSQAEILTNEPSTPPRRSSTFRENSTSPVSLPRRSLGTPGRFTPTVKARLSIFPEVLERQLQTLESSSSTVPVFRASHVSPETSNLAKRIYRYSVGSSSRTSDLFLERLSEAQDDKEMEREAQTGTTESADKEIVHRTTSTDTVISQADVDESQEGVPQPEVKLNSVYYTDEHDDDEEEDSFAEAPPIGLTAFLDLVGINFLDHISTISRRRTIPQLGSASSSEECSKEDIVKAKAIQMEELESYRDACNLLKESTEASRAFAAEQELKVIKKNPQYFQEFMESDAESQLIMKDRFKLIKVHSNLVTKVDLTGWKAEVLGRQQESLQHHLSKLKEDISRLKSIKANLKKEREKAIPRSVELKRLKEEADERHRSYEQCDKEQLAHLAEAVEEQGSQIDHYNMVREKKEGDLVEIRAKVEQLKLADQNIKTRIATAEKTIREYQYIRPEDLDKANDLLNIIQATHRWEPLRRNSPAGSALLHKAMTVASNDVLELVYDRTLKVSIDLTKIGKDSDAVQVTEFEETAVLDFNLSLTDQQRPMISALAPKKRKPIKEYMNLLHDYTTKIAAKYRPGTVVSKVLHDIAQFWSKINLIRAEVELVRAHHVVDLVAGSAENLKELEANSSSRQMQSQKQPQQLQVAGTTPVIVLDIRVRFTGPSAGARRNAQRGAHSDEDGDTNGNNGHVSSEPVKFYLWFTFTLNDLLSFPASDSFAWRLEVVYGEISHEHIAQVVGPIVKKGGYGVLRDTCVKVNQLLRT